MTNIKAIKEIKSKYNFTESVELLTKKAESLSWKVFKIYDLQDKLKNFGVDVLSLKVISLCNPEISASIISKDYGRIYSALMPCRISIYDLKNGDTFISMINMPATLSTDVKADISEAINSAYNELCDILEDMQLNS
ncbi:MAG: DUF302 domain-containing protein [Bacteroidales bacterium]|nr:DUF302 domain-containing protein [Bacteroidales bacterium]MDD4235525.1 DUF302 domain-containing protein [Bacteroidales bacterium]